MAQRRKLGSAEWDDPAPSVVIEIDRSKRTVCPKELGGCGQVFAEGYFADGTHINVKCRKCLKFYPVTAGEVTAYEHSLQKCPNCKEILFTGTLGRGTAVEIICRRCQHPVKHIILN